LLFITEGNKTLGWCPHTRMHSPMHTRDMKRGGNPPPRHMVARRTVIAITTTMLFLIRSMAYVHEDTLPVYEDRAHSRGMTRVTAPSSTRFMNATACENAFGTMKFKPPAIPAMLTARGVGGIGAEGFGARVDIGILLHTRAVSEAGLSLDFQNAFPDKDSFLLLSESDVMNEFETGNRPRGDAQGTGDDEKKATTTSTGAFMRRVDPPSKSKIPPYGARVAEDKDSHERVKSARLPASAGGHGSLDDSSKASLGGAKAPHDKLDKPVPPPTQREGIANPGITNFPKRGESIANLDNLSEDSLGGGYSSLAGPSKASLDVFCVAYHVTTLLILMPVIVIFAGGGPR
jgi:hypothetical protein